MFQPTQISEDLKKSGGYVPGIRPGKPTADFLDFTMSRLTFAGAIFLTFLYVMPGIVSSGMNSANTMKPTTTARNTSRIGSISLNVVSIVRSTSVS